MRVVVVRTWSRLPNIFSAPCAWYWCELGAVYRIFSKCLQRVVLVLTWSHLRNIFEVLPARVTSTNMDPPIEYFQSSPCAWYWYELGAVYRIFSKCSLRVVLVRTWSRLPNIFKVLPERGTGMNMDPTTEVLPARVPVANLALSTEYFQKAGVTMTLLRVR
jgi:hypothetical protein